MYLRTPLLAAVFLSIVSLFTYQSQAQVLVRPDGEAGRSEHIIIPKGGIVTTIAAGDRPVATYTFDPNEVVDVIVSFDSSPYAATKALAGTASKQTAIATATAAMNSERQQFRADVSMREGAAKQNSTLQTADTHYRHDYRYVFNGLALTTRRWMLDHLRTLSYVAGIYEDRPMQAFDDDSNQIIRADQVWQNLGVTGEGMVIAIIDTGIDYTHPDLGGGIGSNFKVLGGYDFVDEDNDPMDESGHGTHVAGIAAANGSALRGVAPDARLMAFRVLDENGSGPASGVIAGIERAADPDQNPATDDAVDVMNLSLGSPGDADDPASQAIDNAVLAGVVCVVAAGNAGSGYQTVASPGAARGALTVAASNGNTGIADFSSRGPTSLHLMNKPDVAAPGVDIHSSLPGGTYGSLSGTSMAAPAVAGAVALLRQLHPDWTPVMVKSALMQSTANLGHDLWGQGTGLIDVEAAAQMLAMAAPGFLQIGALDLSGTTHVVEETLTLYNVSATPQTYALDAEVPVGTSVYFSQPTVTVPAGQQAQVTVTVSIDTGTVPFTAPFPPAFVGTVTAQSAVATLDVPFTFLKTPQLELSFDEPPKIVVLRSPEVTKVLENIHRQLILLPEGTYDVISMYSSPAEEGDERRQNIAFSVRENVDVRERSSLSISKSEAAHPVMLDLRDTNDETIKHDLSMLRFVHEAPFTVAVSGYQIASLMVSDFSPSYRLESVFYNLAHPSGEDYVLPFILESGFTNPLFRNDPAALRRIDTHVPALPDGSDLTLHLWNWFKLTETARVGHSYYLSELDEHMRITPPVTRTVHYGPKPSSGFGFIGFAEELRLPGPSDSYESFQEKQVFRTAIREIMPERINIYRSVQAIDHADPAISTDAPNWVERLGHAPPYWAARLVPEPTRFQLFYDSSFNPTFFSGASFDVRFGDVPFQLYHDGSLVHEATLRNAASPDFDLLDAPLEDGPHEAVFTFDRYMVDTVPGRATARLEFLASVDWSGETPTNRGDVVPPYLTSFHILSDGVQASALSRDAANQIRFNAHNDETMPASQAELFYHRLGDADWHPLSLLQDGVAFSATWPDDLNLSDGYYALRLRANDAAGNTLDYQADPAFRFGDRTAAMNQAPAAFDLRTPAYGVRLDPATNSAITFTWTASSDADGDALRYTFSLSGPGLDTTRTVNGQTLTLDMDRLQQGATYTWTVHASDGFARIPANQSFTFITEDPLLADDEGAELPKRVALLPNYPNPFNPSTTISFDLPTAAPTRLEVFDVLGRRVALLLDEVQSAGRHTATWEASDASSGVYLCRLTVGDQVLSRYMLLVK